MAGSDYTVSVVVEVPRIDPLTLENMRVEFSFIVTVVDACENTVITFSDPAVVEMTTTVNQSLVESIVARDSASLEYGKRDGFSLCGPRLYEISPELTAGSIITVTSNGNSLQVTLLSSDVTPSPLTYTVTATLEDYPQIPSAIGFFTVEVT